MFYLSLIKSKQPRAAAGHCLVLHFLLVPRGRAGKEKVQGALQKAVTAT